MALPPLEDDGMMMLDGTEFDNSNPMTEDTAAAAASTGEDGDADFFGYSSSSGNDEADASVVKKSKRLDEDSDRDDDEEEEDLSLEDRLKKLTAGLQERCLSLTASLERLRVAMEKQKSQPTPLSSQWLFSTESVCGVKAMAAAADQKVQKQQQQSAKTTNTSSRVGTESSEPCRVIGFNRLKAMIAKELSTHTAKLDALLSMTLVDASDTTAPDEAIISSQLAAIRSATVVLRCSVAPYLHLLTCAIDSDAEHGMVALKHWMQLPNTSARHLQKNPNRNCKALKKLSPDERIGAADLSSTEDGCEVDIVGGNGFRWFKVRAAKGTARSLASLFRHLSTSYQPRDITVSMLDPQLGRLVACAQDPRINGCPWGFPPEVVLVLNEDPGAEVKKALGQRGVTVVHFPPFSTTSSSIATVGRHVPLEAAAGVPLTPAPSVKLSPVSWLPKYIAFDVTALVAVCSDTCNGAADHQFAEEHHILRQQAADELKGERAAVPIIRSLQQYTRWEGGISPDDATASSSVASSTSCQSGTPIGKPACTMLPPAPQVLLDNGLLGQHVDDAEWQEKERDAFGAFLHVATQGRQVTKNTAAAAPPSDDGNVPPLGPYPNWIVSDVAWKEFCWILNTVSGPREFFRASILAQFVRVVGSELISMGEGEAVAPVLSLRESTKIRRRHLDVFGISETLEALTLTATRQFVHAAGEQGATLPVVFHPSRALTERKRLHLESSQEIRTKALVERKERQKQEKASRKRTE